MKHNPKDYTAIQYWGERLRSFQYYIDGQQELAAHDGAPLNAIYKSGGYQDTGARWITMDEVKSEEIKQDYAEWLGEKEKPRASRGE